MSSLVVDRGSPAILVGSARSCFARGSTPARSAAQRDVDWNRRRSSGVHGFDDFGVVDALQVHGRDPEVAVAELTLDDHERDALVSELDGVRVAQLVRGEAATDAGGRRGVA
jgi:hypothetical protein